MRIYIKQKGMICFGWALLVLGVAGLVLPLLQGILFLALGFSILITRSPFFVLQVSRVRNCHPYAEYCIAKLEKISRSRKSENTP